MRLYRKYWFNFIGLQEKYSSGDPILWLLPLFPVSIKWLYLLHRETKAEGSWSQIRLPQKIGKSSNIFSLRLGFVFIFTVVHTSKSNWNFVWFRSFQRSFHMYISRIEREVAFHFKFTVYTVNMVFLFICNEYSTFINKHYYT